MPRISAKICKTTVVIPPLARRLLQMGVYNCQLYNNLGLCCFYAQQYDMTLSSFERALALVGNDEEQADVWYNIGHVAVVSVHRMSQMSLVLNQPVQSHTMNPLINSVGLQNSVYFALCFTVSSFSFLLKLDWGCFLVTEHVRCHCTL